MSELIVSTEILPLPKQTNQAAFALQNLGFRILHIGQTISVEAPANVWQSTFNIEFTMQTKNVMPGLEISDITYPEAMTENMTRDFTNILLSTIFVG